MAGSSPSQVLSQSIEHPGRLLQANKLKMKAGLPLRANLLQLTC